MNDDSKDVIVIKKGAIAMLGIVIIALAAGAGIGYVLKPPQIVLQNNPVEVPSAPTVVSVCGEDNAVKNYLYSDPFQITTQDDLAKVDVNAGDRYVLDNDGKVIGGQKKTNFYTVVCQEK